MNGSIFGNLSTTENLTHAEFKKSSEKIRFSSIIPPNLEINENSNKVQVFARLRPVALDEYPLNQPVSTSRSSNSSAKSTNSTNSSSNSTSNLTSNSTSNSSAFQSNLLEITNTKITLHKLQKTTKSQILKKVTSDSTKLSNSSKKGFLSSSSHRLSNYRGEKSQEFEFTKVIQKETSQRETFEDTAKNLCKKFVEGKDGLLLTYGSTGTGKTHSILGNKQGENPGILIRSIREIFDLIGEGIYDKGDLLPSSHLNDFDKLDELETRSLKASRNIRQRLGEDFAKNVVKQLNAEDEGFDDPNASNFNLSVLEPTKKHILFMSVIEIYNDKIHDLLGEEALILAKDNNSTNMLPPLEIFGKEEVDIRGAKWFPVKNEVEAFQLSGMASKAGAFATTHVNESSSRAHTLFRFKLVSVEKSKDGDIDMCRASELMFTDLAGSESANAETVESSGTKQRNEGKNINTSLLHLKSCLVDLGKAQQKMKKAGSSLNSKSSRIALLTRSRVRACKLTRILGPFFTASPNITMLLCLAPSYLYLGEFASACSFGAENVSSIKLFDNPVPQKFVKLKEKVKNIAKIFGGDKNTEKTTDKISDENTNKYTNINTGKKHDTITDKNTKNQPEKFKKPLFGKITSTSKMIEFSGNTEKQAVKPSKNQTNTRKATKPNPYLAKRIEKEQLASKPKRQKLDEMQVPREKYVKLEQEAASQKLKIQILENTVEELNSKNRYLKLDYDKVNKDHIDLYKEHKQVNKELDSLSEEFKAFEEDHQTCIREHDHLRKLKRAEVDAANRAKDKTRTEKHLELHAQREKMLAEFKKHEAKLDEEREQNKFGFREMIIKKEEEFNGRLGKKDEEILRLKIEVESLQNNLKNSLKESSRVSKECVDSGIVGNVRSVSAPQRRIQELQELLSADKLEESYDNDTSGPLTDYEKTEPIDRKNQSDLFEPVNSQEESYYINSPALLRSRKTPKTVVYRKFIDNTLDETPNIPTLGEDLTRLSEESSEENSGNNSDENSEEASEVDDFEFVNENSFRNSCKNGFGADSDKNESGEKENGKGSRKSERRKVLGLK